MWVLSFLVLSDDGEVKKYWIDIKSRKDEDGDNRSYILIYKRIFPFWGVIYSDYLGWSTIDVEGVIKLSIDKYESNLKAERNRQSQSGKIKSDLNNWDGLIGEDSSKKSYRREIRLSKLMDKKVESKEITSEVESNWFL